jgi:hypothetical protein
MSTMRIVTTGPAGIPGAVGLEFGHGPATDEDGRGLEIYNPMPCPVPPHVAVVAGRVQVSQWSGEVWCVLTIGCKVGEGKETPGAADRDDRMEPARAQ